MHKLIVAADICRGLGLTFSHGFFGEYQLRLCGVVACFVVCPGAQCHSLDAVGLGVAAFSFDFLSLLRDKATESWAGLDFGFSFAI